MKDSVEIASHDLLSESVLASELRYRSLFETTRDGIIILNAENGRIIDVNPFLTELLGYSKEEFIEKEIWEIGFFKDIIESKDKFLEIKQIGYLRFENLPFETYDGKKIDVEFVCNVYKEKDHDLIQCNIRDITKHTLEVDNFQEANRLTNEYLDILFNRAHVPIIIWDSTGKITSCNNAFEELIGYRLNEKGIKKIDILFPENGVESSLNIIKKALEKTIPDVIELDILTNDHKIKSVLWNSTNIIDKGSKKVIATVAEDITDRKRNEDAVRILETRYRRLFESAKDGIIIIDADTGMIIDVNPFLTDLLRYSKADFIGKELWEIGFFRDIAANKEKYAQLQRLEYVRYDNLPLETSEGKKIYVEFVSNVYLVDNKRVIQCNIRDITLRKNAEEEIAMLSHSIKSIKECVSITDLDNNIIFLNKSFLSTYGYSSGELIGKNISIVGSCRNAKNHVDRILPATTILGEWQGELINRRKDGSEFPVFLSTSVIKDKQNKVLGLIGVSTDISDRKNAENELIKAKEKAEESDRLKSAFLSNMSHEIRTPMNGILGFTELLKESDLSGEDRQDYISIIERSGERLLGIINDIISISKVEAGQIDLLVSETNINEQVEFIYNFFKQLAENKKLHLSYTTGFPDKNAMIKTDREKVYAVLTNLINNAIKFTCEGSVEFGYEQAGTLLEFYVKDTGIGIPDNQNELVFERFRQGSELLTRDYEGAGLGLAISKAYIEMLGGKIWFKSESGKAGSSSENNNCGSTFYFTIPYLPVSDIETIERSEIKPDKTESEFRKLKILIAEDDENSQTLLEAYTNDFGREILRVDNGVDAVEACRNNPDLDLILMDIKMPGMNGYEATRKIRAFNKNVIIIAQTAYGFDSDRKKALEAGCDDYFSKPNSRDMLYSMIAGQFNFLQQ